ncbi:MAG TPA: GTP cyclohydrolase I FolE [Chthonomonadales bacterium]|nr:GTP cyclohydrolase I FolE [Chthonomonadales bacterium]
MDLEELYRRAIIEIGEDPEREGLRKTPFRAAHALRYLTRGYQQRIDHVLNNAIFEEPYEDMVIVQDIEFYSLCEHHMLPFFGKAHIAYLPAGRIVGISKLARLVDVFARRLQVQERMTLQIASALEEALHPKGVGVVVEARHMCMMARGIEKQNSKVTTSEMRGVFRESRQSREEFLTLLRLDRNV